MGDESGRPSGAGPDGGRRTGRSPSLVSRLMHVYWRFSRPLTGGVRAMVLEGGSAGEGEGSGERVLLVRHGYVAGWHLPGGGVETGDTFEETLAKELREEANVTLTARAELFGLYHCRTVTKRDHVALYVCRHFTQGAFTPTREIVEAGFHPLDALPEGTTAATRRRIEEVRGGLDPAPVW